MSEMTENLLTLEEAAERLRSTPATLRKWRADGSGPYFFKMGKRIYTTQADIDQFVASQRDKR